MKGKLLFQKVFNLSTSDDDAQDLKLPLRSSYGMPLFLPVNE